MDKEEYVCVELRSLSNMIMRFIDANGHIQDVERLTGTNGWIIGFIASHPDEDVFQRDLEKKFGITRSTASKVVNLMVTKGLIERTPVDYDSRLKKLTLTDKSNELADVMYNDSIMMENVLMKGFTQEETETLMDYIARMKGNLKGFSDEPIIKF